MVLVYPEMHLKQFIPEILFIKMEMTMKKNKIKFYIYIILSIYLLSFCLSCGSNDEETNPSSSLSYGVANHASANVVRNGNLSASDIIRAKQLLHIAYGKRSHGEQISEGMKYLVEFANNGGLETSYDTNIFAYNNGGTGGSLDFDDEDPAFDQVAYDDCDWEYTPNIHEMDFEVLTREYLDNNTDVNVVMRVWCSGLGVYSYDPNDHSAINMYYFEKMERLEASYPDVIFVYSTCGLFEGDGLTGNVHLNNELIREYCRTNKKWLYDFADIESYDPDGAYYLNRKVTHGCHYDANGDDVVSFTPNGDPGVPLNGDRNWALEWQADNPGKWFEFTPTGGPDWHTYPINGNMKAYAAWWLWCELAKKIENR